MIKHIISDLARVILFPRDKGKTDKLNAIHKKHLESGDYNFWQQFELNQELLDYYQSISENFNLSIFTSAYIQNYPSLREILDKVFKNIFVAHDLGLKKHDPKVYQKLAELLECETNEILFIDDSQANIDAANEAGIVTILHKENLSTITEIKIFTKPQLGLFA